MQNLETVQLFVVYTKKECHLIPLKIVEINGDPIMVQPRYSFMDTWLLINSDF